MEKARAGTKRVVILAKSIKGGNLLGQKKKWIIVQSSQKEESLPGDY